MAITTLARRLERLWRNSAELRSRNASVGRIIAYNMCFTAKKVPLLPCIARARRDRRQVIAELRIGREADGGVANICLAAPGAGVGDNIILARFARDLARHCGSLTIDFAAHKPERDRWIFSGVDGFREVRNAFLFDAIAPEYTLAIEVSQTATIRHADPDHPALAPRSALAQIVASLKAFQHRNAQDITNQPYSSGPLARRAVYANRTRATFLQGQAAISYGGDDLPLATDPSMLERCGLEGRRYLTVHNGFDPDFVITRAAATKCYPHFASVVSELKLRCPQLLLVQVGSATSTPIEGIDVNLIGQTTMPEIAAIIGSAEFHLDNESGLVHMAACLGTRSCVLFGPTDADYFAYPQNINIRPGCCGGCWWTTESWMDQCPRGFAAAPCMESIAPEDVVQHLVRNLRSPPTPGSGASVQPVTGPESRKLDGKPPPAPFCSFEEGIRDDVAGYLSKAEQ
jgi:hypothetical protein